MENCSFYTAPCTGAIRQLRTGLPVQVCFYTAPCTGAIAKAGSSLVSFIEFLYSPLYGGNRQNCAMLSAISIILCCI